VDTSDLQLKKKQMKQFLLSALAFMTFATANAEITVVKRATNKYTVIVDAAKQLISHHISFSSLNAFDF